MKLAPRGALASIVVGGLLAIGSVAPTYAVGAASPLVPEAGTSAATRQCVAETAAAKDNGVGNLRKLGNCEVDRRLDTITKLQSRVADATALTAGDRDALRSQLTAATSGLTALRAQIDGETDVQVLKADLRKIATDFRIYLLMAPKVADVIAADTELAAVGRLGTRATQLQARIDADKAAGKDVTGAQADLDAMTAKVSQVSPLVAGIPAVGPPAHAGAVQRRDGEAHPRELADQPPEWARPAQRGQGRCTGLRGRPQGAWMIVP